MRRIWRNIVGAACLATLGLATAVWAAPMSSDDANSQSESAPLGGSSQSNPSTGVSSKNPHASTGDKSMDLLLNAKMPTAPLDINAGQNGKGFGDPLANRATPSGTNASGARTSQSGDGSGDSLKQWLKETGAASGEANASAREAGDGSDQRGRTTANRSRSSGDQAGESEVSGFGKAIVFIRENRVVMLVLCALVLILAGAAFVYSNKAASGGRRFD